MKRSFSPSAVRRRRKAPPDRDATSSSRAGLAIRLLGGSDVVQGFHPVLEHLGNGLPRAGERLDGHVGIRLMELRPIGEIIRGVDMLAVKYGALDFLEHRILLLQQFERL